MTSLVSSFEEVQSLNLEPWTPRCRGMAYGSLWYAIYQYLLTERSSSGSDLGIVRTVTDVPLILPYCFPYLDYTSLVSECTLEYEIYHILGKASNERS